MEKVVLDTSIVVKWYVEEEKSEKARQILSEYQKNKLAVVVPEIITLELANALYFGADFKSEILSETLSSFYALNIPHIPITMDLLLPSTDLMEKYNIAIYDALFIALSEKEKATLITADKKHHQKKYSKNIKYL